LTNTLSRKKNIPGRPNRRVAAAIRRVCEGYASINILAAYIQEAFDGYERADEYRKEIKDLKKEIAKGEDDQIYKKIAHAEAMALAETKLANDNLGKALPYVYPKKTEVKSTIEAKVDHTLETKFTTEMIESKITEMASNAGSS
jgi:hypothetical protein